MKKTVLLAMAALGLATSANAENLFTGNQAVTWAETLQIDKEKFENVQVGSKIVVTVAEGATDVIELKADGQWLPGSILTRLDGKTEMSAVVTEGMKVMLVKYGLELCGPSFTVTSVDLVEDFMEVPEGAVWAGYFWIDSNWNTLELFKTAFNEQEPRKIIVNLSAEAGNSEFVMNVLTKWDDDAMKLYGNTLSNTTSVEIEIPEGKTIQDYLPEGQNALMVQGHVENGDSFNITSIVAEPYNTPTAIVEVNTEESDLMYVYSMTGVCVKKSVSKDSAAEGLAPGMYVMGNRKVIVR